MGWKVCDREEKETKPKKTTRKTKTTHVMTALEGRSPSMDGLPRYLYRQCVFRHVQVSR